MCYIPSIILTIQLYFQVSVKALAEFHGTCIAFDYLSDTKLVDMYPILHPKHLMWVQEDMLKFLKSTVKTAEKFISSIEGEGQTARYLRQKNLQQEIYFYIYILLIKTDYK